MIGKEGYASVFRDGFKFRAGERKVRREILEERGAATKKAEREEGKEGKVNGVRIRLGGGRGRTRDDWKGRLCFSLQG